MLKTNLIATRARNRNKLILREGFGIVHHAVSPFVRIVWLELMLFGMNQQNKND